MAKNRKWFCILQNTSPWESSECIIFHVCSDVIGWIPHCLEHKLFASSPPKTNRSNNQTRRLKFQLRASYFCAEFTIYVSFQLRLCVQRFSKKPPEREGSKNTPRRERSTRCKDTLRLFYTLSRFCLVALGDDLTEISFGQSWLAKRAPRHFLAPQSLFATAGGFQTRKLHSL